MTEANPLEGDSPKHKFVLGSLFASASLSVVASALIIYTLAEGTIEFFLAEEATFSSSARNACRSAAGSTPSFLKSAAAWNTCDCAPTSSAEGHAKSKTGTWSQSSVHVLPLRFCQIHSGYLVGAKRHSLRKAASSALRRSVRSGFA